MRFSLTRLITFSASLTFILATLASAQNMRIIDVSFSQDGKQIVYVKEPMGPGNFEMWTYNLATKDIDILVSANGGVQPRFSPDGKTIVFTRYDKTSGTSDLWTISTDGLKLKQITKTPNADEMLPDFMPDGYGVLFTRRHAPPAGTDFYTAGKMSLSEIVGLDLPSGQEIPLVAKDKNPRQAIPYRYEGQDSLYIVAKPDDKPADAYGVKMPSLELMSTDLMPGVKRPDMTLYRRNKGGEGSLRDGVLYVAYGAGEHNFYATGFDISPDGKTVIAAGHPRGSSAMFADDEEEPVAGLWLFDTATKKWTELRPGQQ